MQCDIIVPMYKSRFLAISILNRHRSAGPGEEVILDYKRYELRTVKFFIDALYNCNVDKIPLVDLIKLLQSMSKVGFTETVRGKQEFPCTIEKWENMSCLD